MKKTLSSFVLLISLIACGSANATGLVAGATEATQVANGLLAQATKFASERIQKAQELMDEWLKNNAWFQQAKDMESSINKLNDTYVRLQAISDKATSLITGVRTINSSLITSSKSARDNATDYRYADNLPTSYLPTVSCKVDGSGCEASGTGFTATAAGVKSADLRNALKVSLNTEDIRKVSGEAAEKNAQETALYQAMAQEAYVRANNRITKIMDLQEQISNPSDPANNDMKYITDLQAKIQSQQALLGNEQNKLIALSILQQAQRDAYEQRKREITTYSISGNRDADLVKKGERGAIALGSAASYASVAAMYKLK